MVIFLKIGKLLVKISLVCVVDQRVKRSYVVLVQTVVLALGGGVPGDLGQCSNAAEFLKQ